MILLYYQLINESCVGTLNGDGPCHGDSGGGLTIYHENRWTLRGYKTFRFSICLSFQCNEHGFHEYLF